MPALKALVIGQAGTAGFAAPDAGQPLPTVQDAGRAGRMSTGTLDGHPGRSWGFAEMASLSSALYAATPAFLRTLLTALYAVVRSSMNAKTHAIQTETLFAAECMLSGARTGAGLRIFTAENVGY